MHGLITDAAGDLFGTTEGAGRERIRYGVRARKDQQRSSPTSTSTSATLLKFNGINGDSRLAVCSGDAGGDLFGTTLRAMWRGEQ